MPNDRTWDWPLLLYVATVMLQRPESHFWRMTPRKLRALQDVHLEMNPSGPSKEGSQQRMGYIDQVI